MSTRYVVFCEEDGSYLTHRKNTGMMYRDRSGWSDNLDDARIFSRTSAAVNSANQCETKKKYQIREVEISLKRLD